jgi:DegV family protein with EDD domain
MSRQKIAIVTDSSAYIPAELMQGLDIHVIPLWLIWDEQHFLDGIDIQPQAFYDRLRKSKTLPTSSQPSAKEFEQFFLKSGQKCDAIVAVLVSTKISGTIDCARAALSEITDLPIHIVDSCSSSMGLGFVVLAAARAAAAGKSIEAVVLEAQRMCEQVDLLFVVDTLEYLHRGGRIGGAKRLLGTALQIKPILQFKQGLIQPLSQARTRKKALEQMLMTVEARLAGRTMAEACVVNIDCRADGQALMERVRERFDPGNVYLSDCSPVVGTHVGPGGLGLAFYPAS